MSFIDDPRRLALDPQRVPPSAIAAIAASDPDRPFAVDVGGRALSYGQFHHELRQWCSYLRGIGVAAGERIVSMLPNSIDAHLLWLASCCVGAIEVAVNRDLRGELLRHIVTDSGARRCFVRPEDRQTPLLSGVAGLEVIETPRERSLVAAHAPVAELARPAPADVCTVIYTSGTTGPAKGVMVTWAQLSTAIGRIPRDWLSDDDAFYSPWPMFHLTGRTPMITMLDVGGRFVCRERPSVSQFWTDIDGYGCTVATLSPIAKLLLAEPEQATDRDHPLRVIHLAGEPAVAFERRFGARPVTSYGSSELGFPVIKRQARPDWLSVTGWLRPGYHLRIVDEHGLDVPAGEAGELWIRPPARELLMRGYLGDEASARSRAGRPPIVDGWYRTGDRFSQRPDGALCFLDRMGDTIRRFGENISARALEDIIGAEPGIAECVVLGVPSEIAGQELLLAIEPRPGVVIEPAALFDRLARLLPKHTLPAFVVVLDRLPKTPNGKLAREAARAAIAHAERWRSPAAVTNH